MSKNILWFKKIDKNDLLLVGRKAANLGEMRKLGLNIPDGFTITTNAYTSFLENAKLTKKIKEKIKLINVDDTSILQHLSEDIQSLILETPIDEKIKQEIEKAYTQMSEPGSSIFSYKDEEAFVAVRSSATAEDLPNASFAGQQDTYLYIKGKDKVMRYVQRCWASLYTPRAIFYRAQKGIPHDNIKMAVVIQRMIKSETSGVLFTVNPTTGDNTKMILEAVYGLGEGLVSGKITPDRYIIDKEEIKIISKKLEEQTWKLVQGPDGGTTREDITSDKSSEQKLSDQTIREISQVGKKLEKHYDTPQDIEFAIHLDRIYLLQTRPLTSLPPAPKKENTGKPETPEEIESLEQLFQAQPKEEEKPKTTSIKITPLAEKALETPKPQKHIIEKTLAQPENITGTQVMTLLKIPDEIKGNHVASDGVGLLRAERIIAEHGKHPAYYFNDKNKLNELKQLLKKHLKEVSKNHKNQPVWYRTIDVLTNEFSNLKGAELALKEKNPILGWHGIRQSLDNPEVLDAELQIIKELHTEGIQNIGIILPFTNNVNELSKVKRKMKEIDLETKIGITVETPAAAINIQDYINEGIDLALIGLTDLTQLTLGVDRNNPKVKKHWDPENPAIIHLIKHIIEPCKKHGVTTSIAGVPNKPELIKELVNLGLDIITVRPDQINPVKKAVAEQERKIILGYLKKP